MSSGRKEEAEEEEDEEAPRVGAAAVCIVLRDSLVCQIDAPVPPYIQDGRLV